MAIDNKALHDTFAAFGNILSCKVAQDEQGQSKGYGFVHYETDEAASQAIKHVNGMLLNEKKVYVGHHIPKRDRQSKFEEMKANFTNVYVKNISPDVSDQEFRDIFEKFGEVTSASLARDQETGKSRGFGFVNYATHESASAAVDDLHGKDFRGQDLYVGRAQKKHEREEELRRSYEAARQEKQSKYTGVNLYIKNLDDEVDDDKLRQMFSEFGPITSAKVMRDANFDSGDEDSQGKDKENKKDYSEDEEGSEKKKGDRKFGKSKGFGFVCFSNPDDATKAVTEMNQRMVNNKPLYVALAQRKDVRKNQLEASIQARNQIRIQQQAAVGGIPQPFMQPQVFYAPGQPAAFGMPPAGGRGMPYPQPGVGMPTVQGGRPGQYPANFAAPAGWPRRHAPRSPCRACTDCRASSPRASRSRPTTQPTWRPCSRSRTRRLSAAAVCRPVAVGPSRASACQPTWPACKPVPACRATRLALASRTTWELDVEACLAATRCRASPAPPRPAAECPARWAAWL